MQSFIEWWDVIIGVGTTVWEVMDMRVVGCAVAVMDVEEGDGRTITIGRASWVGMGVAGPSLRLRVITNQRPLGGACRPRWWRWGRRLKLCWSGHWNE